MAFGTGPIATEHPFPCQTLVACLVPNILRLPVVNVVSRRLSAHSDADCYSFSLYAPPPKKILLSSSDGRQQTEQHPVLTGRPPARPDLVHSMAQHLRQHFDSVRCDDHTPVTRAPPAARHPLLHSPNVPLSPPPHLLLRTPPRVLGCPGLQANTSRWCSGRCSGWVPRSSTSSMRRRIHNTAGREAGGVASCPAQALDRAQKNRGRGLGCVLWLGCGKGSPGPQRVL